VGGGETVRFFHAIKDGVDVVFVDHPAFLARVWGKTGAKLYGRGSGADWDDNTARFALFNRAALAALEALPFTAGQATDAIIANDWHTALLPVLITDVHRPAGRFTATKVALCCHNAAFQGRAWPETWEVLGLPASSRPKFAFADGVDKVFVESEGGAPPTPAAGRKFAKLNWLKAGLLSADKVLTVSPNYAAELMSGEEMGVELAEVWKGVGVEGIANGMSAGEWSPASDAFLEVQFDKDSVVEGKAAAKAALQGEVGLPVDPAAPLFGFIGRLEEQKGVDIILAALPELLGGGGGGGGPGPTPQVVILGTGKADLEASVEGLADAFPGAAAGVVEFSPRLAHLINAGADYALIPSRFEPCGIVQLQAMGCGTIPIVSSTGGLVDTVLDGVTGYHMGPVHADGLDPADGAALAATARRAVAAYGSPAFRAMQAACIGQDLSWAQPALKWEAVIEEMLGEGGGAAAAAGKKAGVVTPAVAAA
jgi:granule-bound starch synthase